MKKYHLFLIVLLSICTCETTLAQKSAVADKKYSELANYDESKVPQYTLPDPLTFNDGEKVKTVKEWEKKRRPEILNTFRTYMYGKTPGKPKNMHWTIESVDREALNGRATRKLITIYFSKGESDPCLHLQIYLPNDVKGPIPVFLGISFLPNYSIYDDPGVKLPEKTTNTTLSTRFPVKRGTMKEAWQLDLLLQNGYGLATFCYSDIDPDADNGFKNGVQPLFYKKNQQFPMPDEWGSIAAWAWGASRAMDYLEKDKEIDSKHVAIVGHSRLGKTAVWAGASDQRFALVISGNSGCCGAAISRRMFGETIEAYNVRFPHHFNGNFKQFNGREKYLPFDQHELIALVAPRPIYIASASEDNWSDQKGEFLGGKGAEPVYALYGLPGIGAESMPNIDVPLTDGTIAYHNRTGPHALLRYDWVQFIKFANRFMKTKK
ncbi:acetylxylan esterase [uncultured Bacteroides sp.]|uniref:glucuronyl esterase domain-containing protein n=1 Tax=uncultured Bacteroides sp. TaxID=162156 RepID=UPI002AA95D82|nr:acetylxylan esterase [uncultured Bacteroides sp.]